MGNRVSGIKFIVRVKTNDPLALDGVTDTGTTSMRTIRGFVKADTSDLAEFGKAIAKVDKIKSDIVAGGGEIQGDFNSTVGSIIMNDDGSATDEDESADADASE